MAKSKKQTKRKKQHNDRQFNKLSKTSTKHKIHKTIANRNTGQYHYKKHNTTTKTNKPQMPKLNNDQHDANSNKQTNKQTNKHTNELINNQSIKRTNKQQTQTNKQTNKQ